jgi:hypothetical protein
MDIVDVEWRKGGPQDKTPEPIKVGEMVSSAQRSPWAWE